MGFVGDGTGHGGVAQQTRGRGSGRVGAFHIAADDDGVLVAELDADVLLLDAWELAVKLVVLLRLSHVEAGREGLVLAARLTGLAGILLREVLVPVVDEADQATEVAEVVAGDCVKWAVGEDRHLDVGWRVDAS